MPNRNEPCWCGSGLKFEKCHLDREEQKALPIGKIQHSIRQDFGQKRCLHPEATLGKCTKVIDAHTVQRARTLQALLDASNHVLAFYPLNTDGDNQPELRKVGWCQASTFSGFCGYHDSTTFAPIEQGAFKFTSETAFLLSYRALCHELFQKIASENARVRHQQLIDCGESPNMQREIQHRFAVGLAGVRKAITDLVEIKRNADKDLLAKDYSAWRFACLRFIGPLCFATSGATSPNQDLRGVPLQTLHDPSSQLEHLYVSVVTDGGSPMIVLGWMQEHSAPQRFVDSLVRIDPSLLPAYFLQYVFAHLENVYFSEEWWGSLSLPDQKKIQVLASNTNAYYFPPIYAVAPTVPWLLQSIECLT